MFSSGIATIFVTDMDRAVKFYIDILGLKLTQRFGNHWASVAAGQLAIGLHPASAQNPAGQDGSTTIGLMVEGKIDDAVSTLRQRGVKFRGAVAEDDGGRFVYFEDPDGNSMYIIEVRVWSSPNSSQNPEYQSA
jgi:catechol 2,3-dioxygenase-like lactoylglutathione lyase family enzyme